MSIEGCIDVPLSKSDLAVTSESQHPISLPIDDTTQAATGMVFLCHLTGKPWIETHNNDLNSSLLFFAVRNVSSCNIYG
jgi:hypothetical protein